jgi:hypothetical protein
MIPKPPEPVPGPLTEHLNTRLRIAPWQEQQEAVNAAHTYPLESRAGGSLGDWIQYLHRDPSLSTGDAGDAMKRIFGIFQRENRTELLVSRLAAIENATHSELMREKTAAAELADENRFLKRMLDDRDRQYRALQNEFVSLHRNWIWRTIRAVQSDLGRLRRMLRPSPTAGQQG